MQRDEEHKRYQLQIEDRSSGYPRHHTIGVDFVTTGEYPHAAREPSRHAATLDGDDHRVARRRRAPQADEPDDAADGRRSAARRRRATGSRPSRRRAQARDEGEPTDVESLDELVEFFIAAGKKGVAINRYKGLGEMNPDTLWETTMDPAMRTLLQVRAEDHTEADLMFTTLMGDQVEPRRKFIEDNALDVKNLDI